jgi:hypothetical protein
VIHDFQEGSSTRSIAVTCERRRRRRRRTTTTTTTTTTDFRSE